MPEQSKGAAYQAFLGFYNGHLKAMGLDKPGLVQQAANFALVGATTFKCNVAVVLVLFAASEVQPARC